MMQKTNKYMMLYLIWRERKKKKKGKKVYKIIVFPLGFMDGLVEKSSTATTGEMAP